MTNCLAHPAINMNQMLLKLLLHMEQDGIPDFEDQIEIHRIN